MPVTPAFQVECEYARCLQVLAHTGILRNLPTVGIPGVVGIDGREYPFPTLKQVIAIFAHNQEFIARKVPQGFDRLQLTPLASPILILVDRLKEILLASASDGNVYQTRHSPTDPLIPTRVNPDRTVWMWETLRQYLDTDEVVYFPWEHSTNHCGMQKGEAINNGEICAVPGWSVGLVESFPILPAQGQGKNLGGRRQLEIGLSPREYLAALKAEVYQGETGKTHEDFIISFLSRLYSSHEISHDRTDDNGCWLLGEYVKYVEKVRSDLVPTGWWVRDFGRLRLDAHRPGNKRCSHSFGASTIVRLHRV